MGENSSFLETETLEIMSVWSVKSVSWDSKETTDDDSDRSWENSLAKSSMIGLTANDIDMCFYVCMLYTYGMDDCLCRSGLPCAFFGRENCINNC